MKWSQEQEAVFEWFANPAMRARALVVRARAGTGKTTTIKAAFERAPEQRMLYCVFNKKNQIEAEAKIRDPRVQVKTLHSLGYSYIRRQWPMAKADGRVEFARVDRACPNCGDEFKGDVRKLVSLAKNLLQVPSIDSLAQLADDWGLGEADAVDAMAASAYAVMAESLKGPDAQGRISFDDMVWLPVAARLVRPWFDLVVVDECQDMNVNQLMMARGACRSNGRICVVGDDRQAIYGFRGADSDGMARMEHELKAERLGLCVTFRCPRKVVELASIEVPDYQAAEGNAEGVVGAVGESQLLNEVEPGNAILSRLNAPLMPLCLALIRKGVPAMVEGRDVGKQLVNLVHKLKANSVPDLCRKLDAWVQRQLARMGNADPEDVQKKADALNDQADTLKAVAADAKSVDEVISRVESMFKDIEKENRPMVVLSSVHKAKGLEWDRVYMLQSTFKQNRGGEEANIYYVAVTRAKRELFMVRDK